MYLPLAAVFEIVLFTKLSIVKNAETSSSPKRESFFDLAETHKLVCPIKQYEMPGYTGTSNGSSLCCGYCSVDDNCELYGSCCLEWFNDLDHALSSQFIPKKQECVIPRFQKEISQFRMPDFVSPVEMFSTCNDEHDEIDRLTIELCENPELNYDIESIVPVSSIDFRFTYRNIFCSKCNGESHALFWAVSIYCDQPISFNRENLLYVTEERGCSIYFKPPLNLETEICFSTPDFKISQCNETGLWTTYNWDIELACSMFTDPFNQTYKNYFCYLCNTNTSPFEYLSCDQPFNEQMYTEPQFITTVDLGTLKQQDSVGLLNCNPRKQFTDLKMMVCRDLHCNDYDYDGNSCNPRDIDRSDTCYLVSLKLIFGTMKGVSEQELNRTQLMEALINKFTYHVRDDLLQDVRVYIKTVELNGISVIDYLVVQFYIVAFRNIDLFIKSLHGRICFIGISNSLPFCEFTVYEPTRVIEKRLYASSEHNLTEVLNPLNVETLKNNVEFCLNKRQIVITKLHSCLHILLNQNEIPITFRNGYLFVEVISNKFTFSPWEYKLEDEIVKLCLEDYLKIYDAMSKEQTTTQRNQANCGRSEQQGNLLCLVSLCTFCAIFIALGIEKQSSHE